MVSSPVAASNTAAREDTMLERIFGTVMIVVVGLLGTAAGARQSAVATGLQEQDGSLKCRSIRGDLVELRSTTECRPGHAVCFLGEVDANHGLRGTTYFRGEQGAVFPPSAPTFRSYVGSFDYMTASGTLTMREFGLTDPPDPNNPESGVVNAYQRIVSGTGRFEGATGYLFVSGFNRDQRIVTTIHGRVCTPRRD
jgi:hypothetical protein